MRSNAFRSRRALFSLSDESRRTEGRRTEGARKGRNYRDAPVCREGKVPARRQRSTDTSACAHQNPPRCSPRSIDSAIDFVRSTRISDKATPIKRSPFFLFTFSVLFSML